MFVLLSFWPCGAKSQFGLAAQIHHSMFSMLAINTKAMLAINTKAIESVPNLFCRRNWRGSVHGMPSWFICKRVW
jgi:hypothetical protein